MDVIDNPNFPKADDQMINMSEIKDFGHNDFLTYSILQVLKSSIEDLGKYILAVENVEAVMYGDLEKEIKTKEKKLKEHFEKVNGDKQKINEFLHEPENLPYAKKIEIKKAQIENEIGSGEAKADMRLRLLYSYKFRELYKFIKSKTPDEVIADL